MTFKEGLSWLNFGEIDTVLGGQTAAGFTDAEKQRLRLGLWPMTQKPGLDPQNQGILMQPVSKFRDLVTRSVTWQQWAGARAGKDVYFHANRTQIELDDQGIQLFINTKMPMPFIIVWVQDSQTMPRRCMSTYNLVFFIQDSAKYRNEHNRSANYYASLVGMVVKDLEDMIRELRGSVPDTKVITNISPPQRTNINQRDLQADIWSSTWHFETGPELR